LRQKLIDGQIADDFYEMNAADRIVDWARKRYDIGNNVTDAAELVARFIMRKKGWTLRYISLHSLQDLVVLLDDDEPLPTPDDLPHISEEEKTKRKASMKYSEFRAAGAALTIQNRVDLYRQEWEQRIGTNFPGVSIESLAGMAAIAGLSEQELEGMNALEICQAAMSALEERGETAYAVGLRDGGSISDKTVVSGIEANATRPNTFDLTEREKDILEAIGKRTMTGEAAAKAAGYKYNSSFRNTLSNLVKRRHLIKGPRSVGYLQPPGVS
jgi:hypothetical protein